MDAIPFSALAAGQCFKLADPADHRVFIKCSADEPIYANGEPVEGLSVQLNEVHAGQPWGFPADIRVYRYYGFTF